MSYVINTVDDERFSLNGIEYYKVFMSFVTSEMIQIFNIYDRCFEIVPYTHFSDITLNGVVYADVIALQSALLPVIYNNEGIGGNVTADLPPTVLVFGNPFFLIKHPSNNNTANKYTIEVNDIITCGFRSTTEYWNEAVYITAGDINNEVNWNFLSRYTDVLT